MEEGQKAENQKPLPAPGVALGSAARLAPGRSARVFLHQGAPHLPPQWLPGRGWRPDSRTD